MIYLLTCKPHGTVHSKIVKTLEKSGREYTIYIRKQIPSELLMKAIQYGHEGIFTIVSKTRGSNLKSNYNDDRVKNYNMLMEMPLSRAVHFLLKDSKTQVLLRDNIVVDTDKKSVINNFNEGWDAVFKNKKVSKQLRMNYRARALEVVPLYTEEEDDEEFNVKQRKKRKSSNKRKTDDESKRKYREYQKKYREKNKEKLKEYQRKYRAMAKESKDNE